jgi:hypothetical protein
LFHTVVGDITQTLKEHIVPLVGELSQGMHNTIGDHGRHMMGHKGMGNGLVG